MSQAFKQTDFYPENALEPLITLYKYKFLNEPSIYEEIDIPEISISGGPEIKPYIRFSPF